MTDTPLIDLLDELLSTSTSTKEATDKMTEALNELPICWLDGELILDVRRACIDTQGRWFHSVDEADKYDQMAVKIIPVKP